MDKKEQEEIIKNYEDIVNRLKSNEISLDEASLEIIIIGKSVQAKLKGEE